MLVFARYAVIVGFVVLVLWAAHTIGNGDRK